MLELTTELKQESKEEKIGGIEELEIHNSFSVYDI